MPSPAGFTAQDAHSPGSATATFIGASAVFTAGCLALTAFNNPKAGPRQAVLAGPSDNYSWCALGHPGEGVGKSKRSAA